MSSIAVFLKNNLATIPYPLGSLLAHLPYGIRPGIGSVYRQRSKEIRQVEKMNIEEKEAFVLMRMKYIVEFAYKKIPFYKKHYDENDFHPDQLKTFTDIHRIPVINKRILQQVSLEERSCHSPNAYQVNTGGSSGKPLSFYVSPDSMGHEWAHMHEIWRSIGFDISDLKVSFGGRSDNKHFLEYDAVRHSFNQNIYQSAEDNKDEIINVFRNRPIKYLHGYPSAIYEFAVFCRQPEHKELLSIVKKNLVGAFFGSEYPTPAWRSLIEQTFDIETVSWYGHTERAVLAYEKSEPFTYEPFLSYGYAETIEVDGKQQLTATAYHNLTSPLIRYNTEDVVEPIRWEGGVLTAFKITDGRIGEYITDANGKRIPLTGLIFGRHHQLFNYCSHIQVMQKKKGLATILYTPIQMDEGFVAENLFDTTDVEVKFTFQPLKSPIKTVSGKVKLLVNE